MAKEKRIEAELELPESIIQHIQSFLTGKEAARTTILSKSWYTAWLTRPNLDFDQNYFIRSFYDHENAERFLGFIDKTLQRYENLNLKIESLRLWHNKFSFYDEENVAKNVIFKAIKMGVTDLCINFGRDNCLFALPHDNCLFALPHEVFGNENLIRLSVIGCKINLGADGKVRCLRLKSLCLNRVLVEGDIIWDIISSCPLIENLSLSGCKVLHKTARTKARMPTLAPFGTPNVGSGPVNRYHFRKLKCLFLNKVNIHTSFFDDFSSKFPCLKDLTLQGCDGFKGIRISGPSLECVNFNWHKKQTLRVKFDVPKIRRFTYTGLDIPSLSFKTGKSNWESSITTTCRSNHDSHAWFLKLNKLLTKLSPSKVSLILFICSKSFDHAGNFQALRKPVVEYLTVYNPSSVCPAFLGNLIRCCRPLFLAHSVIGQCDPEEIRNNSSGGAAHKELMEQANLICSIANQIRRGSCDLGEVNWECFDAAVPVWRPLLPDSSTTQGVKKRICVRLIWGQEPAVYK